MEANQKAGDGLAGTQKEASLRALMLRTGYQLLQENGQRRYGGPPPSWDGPPRREGARSSWGNSREICSKTSWSHCYAFVTFSNKLEAKAAMKQLNNYEIRNGRLLGVCASVDNCRLFVGGIPKTKKREEILSEMRKVTDGVVDVIVYPSAADKSKNRGFAFVEYESHRAAAMARRKLLPGAVERVKKIRDYAFVHFTQREDAISAMNALNGKMVDGSSHRGVCHHPGQFRFPPAAKAHVGGRGLIRTPSVRGELSFPPRSKTEDVTRHLHDCTCRGSGGAGAWGRGYLAYAPTGVGGGGACYGLKADKQAEEKLYDLLPGMELTPMNLGNMKAAAIKPATQVLEELCQKNSWGQPVYQLTRPSARTRDSCSSTRSPSPVPNLHPFTPAKLCVVVEEAKVHAAEHTLQTLCLQTEGSDAAGASAIASVAFPGYALASPAAAASLKQAVSLGQDLTAYATYEGFPAFAVATRHSDGYGVF
ncbi:hypothetical protein F7725_013722 [Dissostichus mawsoni]|uniref:RRM domain-containing protein n=1 Tax=Dissostichus mawsoni TaxID=36200 RepID=A0A7J5YTV2_DISMA|nr:hypothetical protein F7725_013722 [Dissostichus mawsoni]